MKFIYILSIALILGGCASQNSNIYLPSQPQPQHENLSLPETGMFHTIKKGETLWKISRLYHVDIEKIIEANKITNVHNLETGKKILIPEDVDSKAKKKIQYDSKLDFIWPCKGKILNYFDSIKNNVRNNGIDIITKEGTPVHSAAEGKVVFTSENMRGYGKTIIIHHSLDFSSVYTYNQEILVKTGDFVSKGQAIARAGTSGRARGCLVHFEIRKNNKPQNPLYFLP